MTIEEFLLARIHELRDSLERSLTIDPHIYRDVSRMLASQEYLIEWHKKWPVLIEEPPTYRRDETLGLDQFRFEMTQKIVWLTQEEYRKKFGSEPPTAPLLMKMASYCADHPDFNESWRV